MANGAGVVGTSASDLEEFTRRAEAKKEEFESYLERSKLMELVVEVRLSSTRGWGVLGPPDGVWRVEGLL